MEFVNLLLIAWAGWLVWRRPERERRVFTLLVVCTLLTLFLFLVGTRTSVLPGLNY